MENWKYKIGDLVTPIPHDNYEHGVKMVITGQITEEYAQHTERWYICSHFKLGDYVRTKVMESELSPYAPKS